MTKEVGKLDKVGQGFFDAGGNLKSSEALAKESYISGAKKSKKSSESTESDTFSSSTVTNALSAERTRFTKQSNTKISEINVGSDQVDRGITVVKEQLKTARELKSALKDGDTKKADAARARLEKLSKERDELANEISASNRESGPSVEKRLSVGNKSVGPAITVPRAELNKSSQSDLESVKDVNKLIDSVKGDLENLKNQKQEFKAARADVKEAVSAGNAQLDKIEENSIKSISAAESRSELVASAIRATPSIVNANNVNADIVKALTS